MTVEFHPAALDDIFEAASAYESELPRLGDRFVAAVGEALDALNSFPRMGRLVAGASHDDGAPRIHLVERFPYACIYAVIEGGDSAEVYVYSVTHQRRQPDHWLDRLGGS